MNKNIAYVIPLHKKSDLVFRAISSVPDDSRIILCINESIEKWYSNNKPNRSIDVVVSNKSSYQGLVNAGITYLKQFDVDLISILEFDDTIIPTAHHVINEYANDWDKVEIFAPLTCIVKWSEEDDKPVLVGITNESAMAPQMAEEYGYFDFNMMLRTNFLFVNGCYIKPEVFENYGMFKENFEIFYDYEWALRMVYNGVIIRSIPKATHFHTLSDDGAFEAHKALPNEVRDNWLGATRREYFFEDDRVISFKK